MNVEQQSMDELKKATEKIWRNTHKSLEDLLPQTAYWGIVGATKATEPGTKSRVSKLQQKYKLRPVVSKKVFDGKKFYTRDGQKIFPINKNLSQESLQRHGLRRIKKGVKAWSKKSNSFVVFPYAKEKKDKSDKILRIPHAGAAKYGWLGNLKSLGLRTTGTDEGNVRGTIKRPAYHGQKKYGTQESFIIMDNLIDYITATSPQSAQIGMQKAAHKMLGIYKKQLNKVVMEGNLT